jgi:hypothetical protein
MLASLILQGLLLPWNRNIKNQKHQPSTIPSTINHQLLTKYRRGVARTSAGLSLVQFGELLGNRRINEISLRFRVGSLTFCSGTFSSVPFVKIWFAELLVRFRSFRVELLLRVKFGY